MRWKESVTVIVTCLAACGNAEQASSPRPPGEVGPSSELGLRMPVARAAHSAVALPDGRVLLIGGCVLESCETGPESAAVDAFDPRTMRFARAGTLTMRRTSSSATALPSGEILIAGGWSGPEVTAAVEIFDPRSGRSRPAGLLSAPRADAAAVALRDGRVLLLGGYGGGEAKTNVDVFDPGDGSIRRAGSLLVPRAGAAAALLADGRVLVAGGGVTRARRVVPTAEAEIFDPATGTSSRTGALAEARYKHAAVALADGDVLVLGGSDARDAGGKLTSVERYDPRSGTFGPAGRLNEARYKIANAVVLLSNGKVLVAGGGLRSELYDPGTMRSTAVGPGFGSRLNFATATSLQDGSVLVAGGYAEDGIRMSDRAWLFRPTER